MKQLIFDTTDANTIADSDSVGAYIRSSDGTRITHTNDAGNSKDRLDTLGVLADEAGNIVGVTGGALDVNLTTPVVIDVDLDGIYNGATNLTPDSAGSIYHTRAAAIDITDQIERTTAGSLASILAANLSDANAIDVNAFNYGINDSTGDAELLTIDNATGGLNVNVTGMIATTDAALANIAIATAANPLAVANTAEDLVTAPLADRKYLFAYNNGNRTGFIGASGVSAATGYPLDPSASMMMRAGDAIDIEWVGPNTSQEMRTLELS